MPDDNRRSPRPGDGLHGGGRYTFQNTGFGWWRDGEIAETLRTPVGGDAMKANLVVEMIVLESNQNHARAEDTEVCPTLPASMGLGGAMCR